MWKKEQSSGMRLNLSQTQWTFVVSFSRLAKTRADLHKHLRSRPTRTEAATTTTMATLTLRPFKQRQKAISHQQLSSMENELTKRKHQSFSFSFAFAHTQNAYKSKRSVVLSLDFQPSFGTWRFCVFRILFAFLLSLCVADSSLISHCVLVQYTQGKPYGELELESCKSWETGWSNCTLFTRTQLAHMDRGIELAVLSQCRSLLAAFVFRQSSLFGLFHLLSHMWRRKRTATQPSNHVRSGCSNSFSNAFLLFSEVFFSVF